MQVTFTLNFLIFSVFFAGRTMSVLFTQIAILWLNLYF